jgi:hypothetical protein
MEEFVYWLSGYVSAIDGRVKVPNEQDWERIKTALTKVSQGHILGFRLETQGA